MDIKVQVSDDFENRLIESITRAFVQDNNLTSKDKGERYLNIGEAAKHCGVSRATFDRWRKKYKLHEKTVGGVSRYKVSDLETFLRMKNK